MSSFFYYVNPKSSTEERATHTHTHTHRLTTSPEKTQNKRLSSQIIPKAPPSKLSKTMSTILLTDNTEKKKKKKKKHNQYRCKNTTVDQKALKLCVCVYMWVYVCTSLP
jgi:ABC-type xylose transport system permease subunit